MSEYKTPDVYVEEIPTLPQSIAGVSTAVPAFIGYTKKAYGNGSSLTNIPVRISTFLEFQQYFGGASTVAFNVAVEDESITSITKVATPKHLLYYNVEMYFKNGGGACYIISIGDFDKVPAKTDFETGLRALEIEDEPTLIVLSEATTLTDTDYYDLCQQALSQCNKRKDRFALFDTLSTDNNGSGFRNGIGTNNLRYGAAYTPHLISTSVYNYDEANINVTGLGGAAVGEYLSDSNGIKITYSGTQSEDPRIRVLVGSSGDSLGFTIEAINNTLRLTIEGIDAGRSPQAIVDAWNASGIDKQDFSIQVVGDGSANITSGIAAPGTSFTFTTATDATLNSLELTRASLYNNIKSELAKQRVILPSSAIMAGVISSVDRDRGVWKAPANVSLNGVIGPVKKIGNEEQENLNVDPVAGKSINAIRSFPGKGTLVWGARTLAGNDNEWRYISVRRLFNYVEESVKNASAFAVFEANDTATWLKVKGSIESFLYGLWQQGGLAGSTPEAAYYINVGLGRTMTQQDILEGRMIVEIGMAAVRPAEFIILRFSHKLQEE